MIKKFHMQFNTPWIFRVLNQLFFEFFLLTHAYNVRWNNSERNYFGCYFTASEQKSKLLNCWMVKSSFLWKIIIQILVNNLRHVESLHFHATDAVFWLICMVVLFTWINIMLAYMAIVCDPSALSVCTLVFLFSAYWRTNQSWLKWKYLTIN